jgi:CRP-like cAMP-binding protein
MTFLVSSRSWKETITKNQRWRCRTQKSSTFPKYDFLTLLQTNPDVSKGFISLLSKKVAEKEKQLLNLAYNSVRQRTAEALLKVRELKDSKENIQISRDDLAKMVGTASESVIRVLSDFKDEGLIEIDGGKIKIAQPSKT